MKLWLNRGFRILGSAFMVGLACYALSACNQAPPSQQKQALKRVLDSGRQVLLEDPQQSYAVFDSGFHLARKYQDSIYMARFQINRGVAQYHLGRFDKSLANFKAGLRLIRNVTPDSFAIQAKAANNIAVIHDKTQEPDSALKYYEKALTLLQEKPGRSKEVGAIWMNIGNLYLYKDQYQIAINKYLKALERFQEASGTPVNLLRTYENIGIAYTELSDPKLGLEYYEKALNDTADIPKELKANVYGNMANAYRLLDKLEAAERYNQKAMALHQSLGDTYGQYEARKRQVRIALNKGQPQKALSYIADLKEQFQDRATQNTELSKLSLLVCRGHTQLGNDEDALRHCRYALDHAKQNNDTARLESAYEQLGIVYDNMNKPDSAVWAYQKTLQLQAERMRNHKQHYVEELRSHMAFEQQQQRIQLLKRENEIKTLKARRQRTLIYGLSGGLLFLLVAAGFLIHLNRKRRQANRSLQEQKQLVQEQNEALQQANEEIRKASKAQADFIAMVSHEIRTPINGVMGMTALLQDTELDEQQKGYIRSIRSSSNALLTVINDVLDLNRTEQGRLVIHPNVFDLPDLIQDVEALMRPAIEQKGLALYVHVEEAVPEKLYGDSDRIRQMLINLIGNAMKFTEEGYIRLSVDHEGTADEDEDAVRLAFHVSDTGVGIDEETQKRIFKAFEQGQPRKTAKDGVGLGLAICHILTEKMNGRIDLHSVPEEGSVFTLRIPLKLQAPADSETNRDEASLKAQNGNNQRLVWQFPLRILLAEDDQLNQEVARRFLEKLGYQPLVVGDGQAVIDKVKQGYRPDLVLMDIQMPRKDGVTASRELQQLLNDGQRPVIVALTAHAMEGDEEQYRKAGMDDYLTKPFDFEQLRALIKRWGAYVLD